MTPGEMLAAAELGTVVMSGDGSVVAIRGLNGPTPWSLTGSQARYTNGDLLHMSQEWELLHAPTSTDDVRAMLTDAPPGTIVWAAPLVQHRDGRPPRPRAIVAVRSERLDDVLPWTLLRGSAVIRTGGQAMLAESSEWHVARLGEWPS